MNTETKIPTVEEVVKDNTIIAVWLNHKNFIDEKSKKMVPRSYPKSQAITMLKNQSTQRGYQKAYSIAKVERAGQ